MTLRRRVDRLERSRPGAAALPDEVQAELDAAGAMLEATLSMLPDDARAGLLEYQSVLHAADIGDAPPDARRGHPWERAWLDLFMDGLDRVRAHRPAPSADETRALLAAATDGRWP